MSPTPEWYAVAENEIGVHETPGPRATARIVEYHDTCTLHATSDEVPWCSAFVNWCFEQVGIEGTRSAAAVSWLEWGVGIEEGRVGAVVVFEWANGGHHVAFYADEDGDTVSCLGGNQHDGVNVSRFPFDRIVGYRWPSDVV